MKEQELPKLYKGYPTEELLQIWEQLLKDRIPEDTPKEKISAMNGLLREYKIAPVFWV